MFLPSSLRPSLPLSLILILYLPHSLPQLKYVLQHIELGQTHVGFKQVYEGMFEGDHAALGLLKQYLEGPVCNPAQDADNDGMTLLHQAAARSCCVCAKILIIAGTTVSKPNSFGDFPYDYGASIRRSAQLPHASRRLTTPHHASPRLATPHHASPRLATPHHASPHLATLRQPKPTARCLRLPAC